MKKILLAAMFLLTSHQTFSAFPVQKPQKITLIEQKKILPLFSSLYLRATVENHFDNFAEELALFFQQFKAVHEASINSDKWFLRKEKRYCVGVELTLNICPHYKDQAEGMRALLLEKLKVFYNLLYANDPQERRILVVIHTKIRPMRAKL